MILHLPYESSRWRCLRYIDPPPMRQVAFGDDVLPDGTLVCKGDYVCRDLGVSVAYQKS